MMAKKHSINAVRVADELSIKELKSAFKYKLLQEGRKLLIFSVPPQGFLFVYSFGVLIFYDLGHNVVDSVLQTLKKQGVDLVPEKIRGRYEDNYAILEDKKNSVEFEHAKLKKINLETIKMVTWVVARSVALDHYESQVDDMMEEFSKLNKQLKEKGKLKIGTGKLLQKIGTNNSIIEAMLSKLSLFEKPSATWEEEKMNWLFKDMYELFEIEDRFETIEYKLKYLQDNSEIFLEAIRSKREVLLELTIIVLIFIEIVLFVFEII